MKKLLLCALLIFTMCGCSNNKKETAKTIDVSPYLYKVSDANGHYVYLLGTCHPGRDQVKSLDETTEKAIKDSEAIALECSLDQNELQKYQNYLLENSLSDLELTDSIEKLKELYPSLKRYQLNQFNAMAISSLVTNDILDEINGNNETSIDSYLYESSQDNDIPFEEMEGIEFQMKLFSQLSLEAPNAILESLQYREQLIEASKSILDSYYDHDLEKLDQIYSYQENPASQYPDEQLLYQKLLIIDRNQNMQNKIIDYLNQGKVVFIGVGVGHVAGDIGLVSSLTKAGYTVEPLDNKKSGN